MQNPTKRTAFFISDGTGLTAEALGRSLLAQFDSTKCTMVTKPYIDTTEKAEDLIHTIAEVGKKDGSRPIIIDTIVNKEIRSIISKCEAFKIDIFSTFLKPLEQELGTKSSYTVGKNVLTPERELMYMSRIEAVHFALANDDGLRTHHYKDADIILVGVSRSGKTPTCIYLALQFGIRAANYPITDEDLLDTELPKALRPYKNKLFGLTINPQRLHQIRQERRPNSQYSSIEQCQTEVRMVEDIYKNHHINFLDSTAHSVEEISARILLNAGIERRY